MARGFVGALQKMAAGLEELGAIIEDHERRIKKLESFRETATPILWEKMVGSPMKPIRKPRKR